jgi:glycosyltransferase involved in cell wall biosynthesis
MSAISVIIPTYNGTRFVAEAVESVWRQTRPPDEIVVVDDRSTDGTADVADALARRSPVPMSVIRLPRNSGGPARPINAGVRAARGEYVAVLDHDDVFLPDKLASEAAILRLSPSVSVAGSFCGCRSHPDQTFQSVEHEGLSEFLSRAAYRQLETALVLRGGVALEALLRRGNFLFGYPGFMFRRPDWERKGGVDESLRIASDYDLLCWLCTQGDLAIMPRIQYLRRLHDRNVTNDGERMELDVAHVRAKYARPACGLTSDSRLIAELRSCFAHRAYWAREQGNYRKSARYYRCLLRVGGWRAGDVASLLKLPVHWLFRGLCRRAGTSKAPPWIGTIVHG